MFGIVLSSAVTIFQIYVLWRLCSVPFVKNRIPVKYIIITGILLWACFFFSRVFGHDGTGSLGVILKFVSMTWMAVLFLTFIPLFVIDLFTGFGYFLPRYAGQARGFALIVGLLLSGIALVQGLRPPVIHDYDISLRDLKDNFEGITIVVVSDTHLSSLIGADWLKARIVQISDLKPDIIVLLGDISEGHGESREELLPVLNTLSAPLGVWAVLGNHESHSIRSGGKSLLEKTRFHLLRNTWHEPRPGLVLAGVDDLTSSLGSGRNNDLISQALSNRPQGATILLSHSPLQVEKAANAGVDSYFFEIIKKTAFHVFDNHFSRSDRY